MVGASARHGPHHSAQKSTIVSCWLPMTSLSKLPSVKVTILSEAIESQSPFFFDPGGFAPADSLTASLAGTPSSPRRAADSRALARSVTQFVTRGRAARVDT